MIGVLLILNSRGEIIVSRAFRDGLSIRVLADTFKHAIVASNKADRCPVNVIDRVAYFHMRFEGIYFVACSNGNANATAIYQYFIRLVQLLTSFLGGEPITEESLKDHFVMVQEIIDETLDFGYPQLTEVDALKAYIKTGGEDGEGASGGRGGIKKDVTTGTRAAAAVTAKATGSIPWRNEGIVYRDNEVYVHFVEEINLLMGSDGDILQRDVSGVVKFKGFLSGMPECELQLNDITSLSGRGGDDFAAIGGSALTTSSAASSGGGNTKAGGGVVLDDVTFHPCVRLSAFGNNRTITFIPPDGEFVLMTYRTSGAVQPPISVLFPRVEEVSKTRMNIDFRLKSDFPKGVEANDVVIKIPCPSNTANVSVRVKSGKAKYVPTEQSIVWKLKSLAAFEEVPFSVEISLIAATVASSEKGWTKPPITVKFSAPLYAASGLQASQLNIREPKLGYTTRKWVKYQTNGGEYECRLGDVKKVGGSGGASGNEQSQ